MAAMIFDVLVAVNGINQVHRSAAGYHEYVFDPDTGKLFSDIIGDFFHYWMFLPFRFSLILYHRLRSKTRRKS